MKFEYGLSRVYYNGKWGCIDRKGKMVVPAEYDFMWFFNDGIALVGKEAGGKLKCGFINSKGKLVIPLKYERFWIDSLS